MVNTKRYKELVEQLQAQNITLVAVTKGKRVEEIQALYDLGQRDFGENYVQELIPKKENLPNDIRWHFIGHLQKNKVKYIAPFVHLIQSVDSLQLLEEIEKQAKKNKRALPCFLEFQIGEEESKTGLPVGTENITDFFGYPHAPVHGIMGMGSLTEDTNKTVKEFQQLKKLFKTLKAENKYIQTLSMGMSGDYELAITEGSTMVRIGSLLFS